MSSIVLGKRVGCPLVPRTPTKRRVLQLDTPAQTPDGKCRDMSATPKGISPYSPVKSVLRRSATATITGRDKELTAIDSFIKGTERLLYVCGPPGTGKSACVSHYLATAKDALQKTICININCVSLRKPDAIYAQVLAGLGQIGSSAAELKQYLQTQTKQDILIILDEVDYLNSHSSNNANILYTFFELGTVSRVKTIGIANALRLTDSMLPHLRRRGIEPIVLRFKPYTPAEITNILTARVSHVSLPVASTSLVSPGALVFLGRKMAKATGDIRKALDILRSSIEHVESEYRSALSSLSPNNSESPRLAQVTVQHVARVATDALGGGGATGQDRVAALGVHEKAILCTMVAKETTTLDTTFAAYTTLCKRDRMLAPLPRTEFDTVLAGLLDHGILSHPTGAKQGVTTRSPSKRNTAAKGTLLLGVNKFDVINGTSGTGMLQRFFE